MTMSGGLLHRKVRRALVAYSVRNLDLHTWMLRRQGKTGRNRRTAVVSRGQSDYCVFYLFSNEHIFDIQVPTRDLVSHNVLQLRIVIVASRSNYDNNVNYPHKTAVTGA